MDRDAWFEQKCLAVHNGLGGKGKAIVGLVEPACQNYRSRELPFWCWWNPAAIFDCLHRRYLELGLRVHGEAAIRAELWTWDQHNSGITQELLLRAREPFRRFSPWKILDSTVDDQSGEAIRRIIGAREVKELAAVFDSSHPDELKAREDLSEIAHFLNTLDIVQLVLRKAATAEAMRILAQIRAARTEVAKRIQALTLLEHQMFMRESDQTVVLRRFAQSHSDLIHVDSMGGHSLPDRLGSRSRIPDWLHNLVFARGGRLFHSSAGRNSKPGHRF